MDFKDLIKQIGDRVLKLKDQIHTEEATKNAFIIKVLTLQAGNGFVLQYRYMTF